MFYEAISEGRRHAGLEHWLPLFYDGMDTFFAYAPDAAVVLDAQAEEARTAREALILEYFDARRVMASTLAIQLGAADAGIGHGLPRGSQAPRQGARDRRLRHAGARQRLQPGHSGDLPRREVGPPRGWPPARAASRPT